MNRHRDLAEAHRKLAAATADPESRKLYLLHAVAHDAKADEEKKR